MKIAIYAGTVRSGGSGTVVAKIIESLQAKNLDVIVICGDRETVNRLIKNNSISESQIHEFFVGQPNWKVYLYSKFKLRKFKCDYMISLNQYVPCEAKKIIYFVNLFNFIKDPAGNWLRNFLLRFDGKKAVKNADISLFESEYLLNTARQTTKVVKQNQYVEYIGLAKEFIDSSRRQPIKKKDQVVAVTSPSEHKNISELIQIFSLIKKNKIANKLIIIGGQNKEDWLRLFEQYNLDVDKENIEITGPIERAAIQKKYRESKYIICSSRWESFYMVALEAMENYCPVIINEASSANESLNGNGVFYRTGELDKLEGNLLTIGEEEYRELIESGRSYSETFKETKKFKLAKYL